MIYSVPIPNAPGYVYFEGSGTFPATGQYTKPRGAAVRGLFAPEQCAAVLPADARQVGTGQEARGRIATADGTAMGSRQSASGAVALQVLTGIGVAWITRKWWGWK